MSAKLFLVPKEKLAAMTPEELLETPKEKLAAMTPEELLHTKEILGCSFSFS